MLVMKSSGISLKTIFYIICVALITVNLSLWPISSILALIHLAIMLVIIMLSVITFRYNKNRVFDVSKNLKEFFDIDVDVEEEEKRKGRTKKHSKREK